MPYYVIITELVTSPEEAAKHRDAHYAFIESLKNQGKIFASGPFADGKGGMIILSAESLEEAERTIKEDPYIKSGVRRCVMIREWKRAF